MFRLWLAADKYGKQSTDFARKWHLGIEPLQKSLVSKAEMLVNEEWLKAKALLPNAERICKVVILVPTRSQRMEALLDVEKLQSLMLAMFLKRVAKSNSLFRRSLTGSLATRLDCATAQSLGLLHLTIVNCPMSEWNYAPELTLVVGNSPCFDETAGPNSTSKSRSVSKNKQSRSEKHIVRSQTKDSFDPSSSSHSVTVSDTPHTPHTLSDKEDLSILPPIVWVGVGEGIDLWPSPLCPEHIEVLNAQWTPEDLGDLKCGKTDKLLKEWRKEAQLKSASPLKSRWSRFRSPVFLAACHRQHSDRLAFSYSLGKV